MANNCAAIAATMQGCNREALVFHEVAKNMAS